MWANNVPRGGEDHEQGCRIEHASAQVSVNSVHPGYINTGMAEYGATAALFIPERLSSVGVVACVGPHDVSEMAVTFSRAHPSSSPLSLEHTFIMRVRLALLSPYLKWSQYA